MGKPKSGLPILKSDLVTSEPMLRSVEELSKALAEKAPPGMWWSLVTEDEIPDTCTLWIKLDILREWLPIGEARIKDIRCTCKFCSDACFH